MTSIERWVSAAVQLTALSFAALECPACAAPANSPACNVERVFYPYETHNAAGKWTGTRDFEMVLSRDACEVKHLWTPDVACEFMYGTSHGSTGVSCGREFDPRWRLLAADDDRSYFGTKGEGARAVVPSSGELNETYAHLGDDDAPKTIYHDDFPKRFVSVGPPTTVANPDLATTMQSFRWRTMGDEDRLGISADAVVDCLKYQFGIIFNPADPGGDGRRQFADVERDMASFLGDLRLEHVDDPVGQLRDLHTLLGRDRLLRPVTECTRHPGAVQDQP